MLAEAGFDFRNRCVDALHLTLELEADKHHAARLLRLVPRALLEAMRFLTPTLVYVLRPR